MNILLSGLPMPPQSNNCYVNNPKTGGRFPTRELKDYQKAMRQWRLEHLALANQAKAELVARFKSEQRFIRVDRYFVFRKDQVISLDGTAKRMDATNRIKCLDDALSEEILGLDDSWFATGYIAKLLGPAASVTVCMTIEECGLMTEDDLLAPGITYSVPWAVAFQRLTWEQYPVTIQGDP